MGQKEYNYEYDAGKVVRATESDITADTNEFVVGKVVVNTIRYYYDSEGKMTKKVITPASGSEQTVYYENSDDNTIVKFSAGGRTVTSHSKTDNFGRKVFDELQLGTGFVSRQFQYHAGEVTDEHKDAEKLKSSATTQLVSQIVLSNGTTLSYGYDAEERITSVVETYTVDEQTITNTTLYTYDALGQLLTETVNGEVVNSMEYDNYGNITKKNGKAYTYGDAKWKDLLTGFGDQTISYDAQGNPVKYLGHTLTWEKGRQLKRFIKSDGTTIDYTYNANGIRTSKTVNGIKHTYTLDGTKILRECWNYNEATKTYKDILVPLYDNEDSVCGITYNQVPYYFLKNLQGDIVAVTDKNGDVVARYSYDAWGKCTVSQDFSDCGIAQINPYRYRGYYFDQETGLYYLQSRYYDPEVGRFVNSDEVDYIVSQSNLINHNLFVYCENDPVNHSDHFGYFAIPWQIKVGLAVGVGSAVWEVVKYIAKNWYKKKSAWSYIVGLGKVAAKGFIRGFIVGIISTIPKAWQYGLIGGCFGLLFAIMEGKVKTVSAGVSAFMNGWTKGVFTKLLSKLFPALLKSLKLKTNQKQLINFALSQLSSYGISKFFEW